MYKPVVFFSMRVDSPTCSNLQSLRLGGPGSLGGGSNDSTPFATSRSISTLNRSPSGVRAAMLRCCACKAACLCACAWPGREPDVPCRMHVHVAARAAAFMAPSHSPGLAVMHRPLCRAPPRRASYRPRQAAAHHQRPRLPAAPAVRRGRRQQQRHLQWTTPLQTCLAWARLLAAAAASSCRPASHRRDPRRLMLRQVLAPGQCGRSRLQRSHSPICWLDGMTLKPCLLLGPSRRPSRQLAQRQRAQQQALARLAV